MVVNPGYENTACRCNPPRVFRTPFEGWVSRPTSFETYSIKLKLEGSRGGGGIWYHGITVSRYKYIPTYLPHTNQSYISISLRSEAHTFDILSTEPELIVQHTYGWLPSSITLVSSVPTRWHMGAYEDTQRPSLRQGSLRVHD